MEPRNAIMRRPPRGYRAEVMLEVADERRDPQTRVLGSQRTAGVRKDIGVDVERDELTQGTAVEQRA